jgi:putative NADH-flavin reductase
MKKKIVIFGATGGTGRQLVTQALEQDFEVTAFVRNPARLDVSHPKLSIEQGDVLTPKDVDKAIQGQEAVLSALGVKPGRKPVCTQGIINILDAMNKHHLSRLVVESAYGARDSKRGFYARLLWVFLKSVMKDKDEMEEVIEKSNLEWIVVRPSILTNGPLTGTYRKGHGLTVKGLPRISRADVADCMLKLIKDDNHINQFLTISY